MSKSSRMGRVAVYGVAGLATAAIGATAANAFATGTAPAPTPAPAAAPAVKQAVPPPAKTSPAPAAKPATGKAAAAPKPIAPAKVATPAKKVRVAPAATHRSSAKPHRVAKPAAARATPERKRFVVQAAAAPVVKTTVPGSVGKVLTHAEQRVTAAEQELTKIKNDLAKLRESLRPDAHREHHAKPARDEAHAGHRKTGERKTVAPARTIRKQVVPPQRPVRDTGPCKSVQQSKQGANTWSSSSAVVCGSGTVEVG